MCWHSWITSAPEPMNCSTFQRYHDSEDKITHTPAQSPKFRWAQFENHCVRGDATMSDCPVLTLRWVWSLSRTRSTRWPCFLVVRWLTVIGVSHVTLGVAKTNHVIRPPGNNVGTGTLVKKNYVALWFEENGKMSRWFHSSIQCGFFRSLLHCTKVVKLYIYIRSRNYDPMSQVRKFK